MGWKIFKNWKKNYYRLFYYRKIYNKSPDDVIMMSCFCAHLWIRALHWYKFDEIQKLFRHWSGGQKNMHTLNGLWGRNGRRKGKNKSSSVCQQNRGLFGILLLILAIHNPVRHQEVVIESPFCRPLWDKLSTKPHSVTAQSVGKLDLF